MNTSDSVKSILLNPFVVVFIEVPILIVILAKMDILPIKFGAQYGFKESECITRSISDYGYLITCEREVLEGNSYNSGY